MNETQRKQIKGALLKCAEENENKVTPTFCVVVSSVCKSAAERIEELEKQLEAEKKLNEEIKVRFVKCNTCTDEMKSKCLMFSENLCEGDRCEELVDLIELMNKSDLQKENARLKLELEALDGQTPWKDIKDKSEVIGRLTKAKDLIKRLLATPKSIYGRDEDGELTSFFNPDYEELKKQAEQFLKETE